jgi:hypothetical protein
LNRIASDGERDRNCLRRRFGGKRRGGGVRYDYGDATPDQISDRFLDQIIVPL